MSCSSGIRGGDWCLSSNVHRFYTFNTGPSLSVRRLHQTTAYGKYNHSIVWMLTQFLFINVFTAWHRHISPMNFIIQQSWSFEGVCVPLRLVSCLFPVLDSQPTATELFQSPPFGSGTVFRSTSHLHRHFPSSALAWRHTSSNCVIYNTLVVPVKWHCHFGHVNRFYLLTYLLTYLQWAWRPYPQYTPHHIIWVTQTLQSVSAFLLCHKFSLVLQYLVQGVQSVPGHSWTAPLS